jgi:hypothetical protein
MDVDPRVEDLTGSEFGDGENSSAVVLIRILKILWSNPAVLPFFDQALSENL